MECVVAIEGTSAVCLRCGRSAPTTMTDPTMVHRRCEPATAECVHRGKRTRDEPCKIGCVSRLVPIYACSLHGECSASRYALPQALPLCLTCKDRTR